MMRRLLVLSLVGMGNICTRRIVNSLGGLLCKMFDHAELVGQALDIGFRTG